MTRQKIILAHIKRDGLGLEIGADCSPIAPKKQGFRVQVLALSRTGELPAGARLEWLQPVDRKQSLS
jgi:hypothetical protein